MGGTTTVYGDRSRDDSSYLSVRGVLLLLILGVLVPVVLVSAAGIVAIALGGTGGDTKSIVIGTLVVSGALAAGGAVIVLAVILQRRTRLARQQVTFLTNVTHELRTPLAAIRLYAQTLELGRATSDEDRQECLAAIVRETHRLDHLVERVLQWRRIREGKRRYQLAPGPVNPALDDALVSFRALLRSGEVTLHTELAATRAVAHDRVAVAEAALNLLVNAYKYTGAEKQIALTSRDAEGGVEISVEDNGVGIPAAEQPHVFEPFYRADERLRAAAPGMGLGLAIVRDTVQAHGGRVGVESRTPHGTTFWIFLPEAPAGAGGNA